MADMTPADVGAIVNGRGYEDGFGGSWAWIIVLLFAFMNNNRYDNDYARESTVNSQFISRDIAGVNQNIFGSTQNLQESICNLKTNVFDTKYDLGREIADTRYAGAIERANLDKDILLGNQVLASSMDRCCCDLKTAIHSEGEATRALITENRIQELQYQLGQANTAVANAVQTQNILGQLGNYYPKTGVNPYAIYGYGTTFGTIA